jgi:hypothetical protein
MQGHIFGEVFLDTPAMRKDIPNSVLIFCRADCQNKRFLVQDALPAITANQFFRANTDHV